MAVHRVVEASASHPQVGVEGDTMTVILASGRATATMVGVLPAGSGQVRWTAGAGVAVAWWDYSVEID